MNNFLNEFIKRSLTAAIGLFCFGGAYLHSSALFSFVLIMILALILIFEWPKLITTPNKFWFATITFLYPILPMMSLLYLNLAYRNHIMLLPLYPFLVSWTYDTCGYLFGKSFGKHKIWPSISPGKSWEGLFGSFVGVFMFNWFVLPQIDSTIFMNYTRGFCIVIIISFLITLLAFSGGMFISYLKRKNNLKDAGAVLPGHGGFLDRFDSVFFVSVATLLTTLIYIK